MSDGARLCHYYGQPGPHPYEPVADEPRTLIYQPGDTVWIMGDGGRVRTYEVQTDGSMVEISQQVAALRLGPR